MDATMYLDIWEPGEKLEPKLEVERDEEDGTVKLQFSHGPSYGPGGQMTIWLSPYLFQQFAADCARVAAEKKPGCSHEYKCMKCGAEEGREFPLGIASSNPA